MIHYSKNHKSIMIHFSNKILHINKIFHKYNKRKIHNNKKYHQKMHNKIFLKIYNNHRMIQNYNKINNNIIIRYNS